MSTWTVQKANGAFKLEGRVEPAPWKTTFFMGHVKMGKEVVFGLQVEVTVTEDGTCARGNDFMVGTACCSALVSSASICTVCKKTVTHPVSDAWSSANDFQKVAEACFDQAGVNPLDACLLAAWIVDAVRESNE